MPDFSIKFTRAEAAKYIGVTAGTLADWACDKSGGPSFYKVGKRAIYIKEDLDNWLASRRIEINPSPEVAALTISPRQKRRVTK